MFAPIFYPYPRSAVVTLSSCTCIVVCLPLKANMSFIDFTKKQNKKKQIYKSVQERNNTNINVASEPGEQLQWAVRYI